MFMLIDCDNFFVSCERIFRPGLKNRPVVVLSSNDGCVIARSYEAKALDIPMGVPFFKVKSFLEKHNGTWLSCNHELYSSISARVMNLIRSYFPEMEIYSIDEAFVRIDDREDYIRVALMIRQAVLKQIGISVSVGIAPSKTLCKLAGDLAKKQSVGKIFALTTPADILPRLQQLDIKDVWGIGRHLNKKLNFMGIFTAADLVKAPLKMLRAKFGITLERTVRELNGISCVEMEEAEHQKSILCSRSFESELNNYEQIRTAIAEFVDSAARRLRGQQALAGGIITFICTNRFRNDRPQYSNSQLICLPEPSNNTARFLQAMDKGLKQIYRPAFRYKRAGIILTDIRAEDDPQTDFFQTPQASLKERRLMQVFDELNNRMGKRTVYFGLQPPKQISFARHDFCSPCYTTRWNELAAVR